MTSNKFFLSPESLASKFDQGTYERGLGVYRHQKVLDYVLNRVNSNEWAIEGAVRGSTREIYDVSVVIEVSAQGHMTFFTGHCSCPVGHNCKHTVALAVKAAYKSGGFQAESAQTDSASKGDQRLSPTELKVLKEAQKQLQDTARREREVQQAQQQVTQWLDLFGDNNGASVIGADSSHSAESGSQTEHIVYTLSPALSGTNQVLQLGFGLSRRLLNGNWAKIKQPRQINASAMTDQDIEIIQLIESMAVRTYSYLQSSHQALLAGASGLLALQLAADTGRLFSVTNDRLIGEPLKLGPPQTVSFAWHELKPPKASGRDADSQLLADPLWALTPQLANAAQGAQWFANSPPLYLHVSARLCGSVELPGVSSEHLSLLVKAPPIPQSAFAQHETTLLRRLAGLPLPPMIKPPEVVQGVMPTAHVHITPVAKNDVDQLGLLRATLRFDYQGNMLYMSHNQTPVLIEQAGATAHASPTRILVHRDLPAEQAAHNSLRAMGMAGDTQGQFYLPFVSSAQQQQWLQWADDDFTSLKNAGFVVSVAPDLSHWIVRADELEVDMAALDAGGLAGEPDTHYRDSQSSWFDLSLGMNIDGKRRNILPLLPELIAQLGSLSHAQGSANGLSESGDVGGSVATMQLPPYIYLQQGDDTSSSGHYLRLPTEPLRPWLQALLELVLERGGHGDDFKGDALRLSRLDALRVGASLDNGKGHAVRWQGADSLRQMISQLNGRSALPDVMVPPGLMAELRPYQQQGLQWLQFLRVNALSGILADDMGLGKTLQTLAHILIEKQAGRLDRPVLVMAPVSLMGNWRREANRFTPELSVLVLHGKDRHQAAADMAHHDVVIAPYSLLQRDRERWQAQAWHLVVLDEAQNIKNANSHAAKIVSELNTRHRLCLSGTPMENHLGELWSLFNFLMPGFLGSQARFKILYRTPIEKHGDSERASQLRRRITPFMLRRAKGEVATDLPEKQETISSVELGDKQADLYETIRLTTEKTVREALNNKGLAKSQIQILDALLKLRQVCCDPRLVRVPAAQKIKQSAKLELLMELLPEMLAEGRRVLLFSQFTSMLELIELELKQRSISWVKLTGQSQKRDQIIERFTSGAVPLFLISLKAGGVGLNLTQADTVIHYDPWWNPAVESQATARAHRIGQTQQVQVYKLVAQGTIEERILALQERKAALADSMYSGAIARKQPLFTESDLAALLEPLGTSFSTSLVGAR